MACPDCGPSQAEAAEMRAQLMRLAAEVQATIAFVDSEMEKPTMPRYPDLPTATKARLGSALNHAH